jgi:hypothetical protein
MAHDHLRLEALEPLRRFAARDFRGWSGLHQPTMVADVAAVFEVDDTPQPALLGSEGRAAGWLTVEAEGYPEGIRVWLDGIDVVLLEGPGVALPDGLQPLLDELGEPDARLDSYLGVFRLEGSEWVYPSRGLSLYVNPENMVLLRVAGYAPATLDDYERRLRLDLEMHRLPHTGRAGSEETP